MCSNYCFIFFIFFSSLLSRGNSKRVIEGVVLLADEGYHVYTCKNDQIVPTVIDDCVKECTWCICKSTPQNPNCNYCWEECVEDTNWYFDCKTEGYYCPSPGGDDDYDRDRRHQNQQNHQDTNSTNQITCNFNPNISCQCGNISQQSNHNHGDISLTTGNSSKNENNNNNNSETFTCPECRCEYGNITQTHTQDDPLNVNCSRQEETITTITNDCSNVCHMLSDQSVTCTSSCTQGGLNCVSNCPTNCSQDCGVSPIVCLDCILACINVCNEATRTCMSNQCGITLPTIGGGAVLALSNISIPNHYLYPSYSDLFLENKDDGFDDHDDNDYYSIEDDEN